jgi:hypothetical protein
VTTSPAPTQTAAPGGNGAPTATATATATPTPGTPPPGPPPSDGGAAASKAAGDLVNAVKSLVTGQVSAQKLLKDLIVTFTADAPGIAEVLITTSPGQASATAAKRKRLIVARGRTVTAGGRTSVAVKATKTGRRLLRKRKKLRAQLIATFDPAVGQTVSRTTRLTVKNARAG